MAHNFKELKIWQRGMDIVDLCYDYIADLPSEEKFNLKSQIVRSACSIPVNIAEGAGKSTKKHFAEFISTSLGSCFELETHLLICERRKFGNEKIRNKILNEVVELKNMIYKFRDTLG
jgi:four helix bundle protein